MARAVDCEDGPLDSHKLAALEKVELNEAADLMRVEVENFRRERETDSKAT